MGAVIQNGEIARSMCSGDAVPSILSMLASSGDAKAIKDSLADMLSMLINSEPDSVAQAIVDSEGINVIRQVLSDHHPGKAQLAMLSILADISRGERGLRHKLSESISAVVPTARAYLKVLGYDTVKSDAAPINAAVEESLPQKNETELAKGKKKKKKKKKIDADSQSRDIISGGTEEEAVKTEPQSEPQPEPQSEPQSEPQPEPEPEPEPKLIVDEAANAIAKLSVEPPEVVEPVSRRRSG